MVDEIKSEILIEQNKSTKETQAKLDMVGDAIMQFVKVNKQNELEAREEELDERNKISEQLAKFEFKGLKQELKRRWSFSRICWWFKFHTWFSFWIFADCN